MQHFLTKLKQTNNNMDALTLVGELNKVDKCYIPLKGVKVVDENDKEITTIILETDNDGKTVLKLVPNKI